MGQPFHFKVAVHVLRDNDGVIYHDTRNKYQRKQGDPVERVIHKIVTEQGKRKCYRHRKKHNKTATPSHCQHYKKG